MVCPFTTIIFFFFNDTATTEIYTLSLHDALPISRVAVREWIALVIIVRLIVRQRVIQLELEVRVEQSLAAEGDAVVAGLCAALDRHQAGRIERQRVDPVQGVTGTSGLVSDRWQPRAPWVPNTGSLRSMNLVR